MAIRGTIAVTLRPVRLGIIVDPASEASLSRAIQMSSMSWGGVYNGLIPAFAEVPHGWAGRGNRSPTPAEIISGYIDCFDPDFIVPTEKKQHDLTEIKGCEVIPFDEAEQALAGNYDALPGARLPEMLGDLAEREFKFVRSVPLQVWLPAIESGTSLLAQALPGVLPPRYQRDCTRILSAYEVTPITSVSPIPSADELCSKAISPLGISRLHLEQFSSGYHRDDGFMFLLDPNNTMDVIDFWNLRAIGHHVMPIANQAVNQEDLRQVAERFIKANYRLMRGNSSVFNRTICVKARSVSDQDFSAAFSQLKLPKTRNDMGPLVYQSWYPRLWNTWARDRDGAPRCRVEAAQDRQELVQTEGEISARSLSPPFLGRFDGIGSIKYANEVSIRCYGHNELVAQVFPRGPDTIARAITGLGYGDWRISETGPVNFPRGDRSIDMVVPNAGRVWQEWLESMGWTASPSSAGLIATRMLNHLGGVFGIGLLAVDGMAELLRDLSDGRSLLKTALRARIAKIISGLKYKPSPESLIEGLVQSKVLRLGVDLACPTCSQSSWHSIRELDYRVECPKCLAEVPLPEHSPLDIRWSYRARGPFGLAGSCHGALPVLFAIRFFDRELNGSTTAWTSFCLKKDQREFEVDLGLLFRSDSAFSPSTFTLFVECKTFGLFETTDIERLVALGAEFPGAVLVFATLRKSLEASEVEALKKIAQAHMESLKQDRPGNPVMILTAHELLSRQRPPRCWTKLAEERGLDPNVKFQWDHSIPHLCDLTLELHLGWDRPKWPY